MIQGNSSGSLATYGICKKQVAADGYIVTRLLIGSMCHRGYLEISSIKGMPLYIAASTAVHTPARGHAPATAAGPCAVAGCAALCMAQQQAPGGSAQGGTEGAGARLCTWDQAHLHPQWGIRRAIAAPSRPPCARRARAGVQAGRSRRSLIARPAGELGGFNSKLVTNRLEIGFQESTILCGFVCTSVSACKCTEQKQ